MIYIKIEMIYSDGNMHQTVIQLASLIELNNIISISNNITCRKFNVKPIAFDRKYVDKDLIEHNIYQIIEQLNKRKISLAKFYSTLLKKAHHFYDKNGRKPKMLFAYYDVMKLIDETERIEMVKLKKIKLNGKSSNIK